MQFNYIISCLSDKVLSPTRRFTRYGIGPLKEGQSLTVANTLRRTLLEGIPGWGITYVSLQGAKHEYTVLPGVRESALDLLLNLRETVLISQYQVKESLLSGFIEKQGPGYLYARDLILPDELAVIDPNQKIATLSNDGQISGKFVIEYGTKYSHKPIAPKTNTFFSTGATFFPVKRVSYSIKKEPDPVTGDISEYIFLEILTDNSLHPRNAISYAVNYLFELFHPLK